MEFYRTSPREISLEVVQQSKSPYQDLIEGLQQNPKTIPSKYFYDAKGSELFVQITKLQEYYLTDCENEILRNQSAEILETLELTKVAKLNIVELGAGDGHKTIHLLRKALQEVSQVTYCPVDISEAALNLLNQKISKALPELKLNPKLIDMETEFEKLPIDPHARNLVLYLGSSIGNFTPSEQKGFVDRLQELLKPGDFVLIGFDLKKDPTFLQAAYNDKQGITRAFNLNLLKHLNEEVGANFATDKFKHWALFNPITSSMESWLVSLVDQSVSFNELDLTVEFKAYEGLHVETSWKFSEEEIQNLATGTGFLQLKNFFDKKNWFTDSLWLRI